jgi:hypothetical protein
MTKTQPQERRDHANQDSTWSSASKLGKKIRELAQRSHRALKTRTVSQDGPADVTDDLHDLRRQVARLRQKIHERRLGALMSWVDALEQQVNERLGSHGTGGPR